jgi:glutamate racemase
MLNNNSPIGFFDSGLGGLSIWKEVNALLPKESTIYLADSINAPYGEKSKQQIIDFSIKITELLINKGCKIIVVACNTATTNAIEILRAKFNIPFIGIEPAIKPAALLTKTGKIGILATKGTLNSELFATASQQLNNEMELIEVEGEGLVSLIETGKIKETKPLLEKYLSLMLSKDVDNIVLGCSHYPFLIPIIKQLIPDHITIIDSGEAVANQLKNVLAQQNFITNTNEVVHQFYTNNDVCLLKDFLNEFNINTSNQEVSFKVF